ncbi:MAG: hypothetical protein AABY26_06390, partial [Nanoarchaeota archaeon]
KSFEMHPGSALDVGVGFQKLTYYGGIPYASCQAREQDFAVSKNLLFSGLVAKNFESLLFKKVTARAYRTTVRSNANTRTIRPTLTTNLPNFSNPLEAPDGVDEWAKSACRAAVEVGAQ